MAQLAGLGAALVEATGAAAKLEAQTKEHAALVSEVKQLKADLAQAHDAAKAAAQTAADDAPTSVRIARDDVGLVKQLVFDRPDGVRRLDVKRDRTGRILALLEASNTMLKVQRDPNGRIASLELA